MPYLERELRLDLPSGQSMFLWGPRKTGKSTFLKNHFPRSLIVDLLDTEEYLDFLRKPSLLRQRLEAAPHKGPVIIDEVQKIPAILDEVHWLIENKKISFVLCGSSARKLKRGQANLLGGRAWRFEMYPLVYHEIKSYDLLRALNNGLLPSHYLHETAVRDLKGYVMDYLKEEVFEEGLTRNMPAFSRFFDTLAFDHGQIVNFSNVARDCAVDVKTVQQYYQILVDTFLGYFVAPFKKRQDRGVITRSPKFYLFDVGVAGALSGRVITRAAGEEFGRALEHLVFMELTAYRGYREKNFPIDFWRTKTGQEVDFVLAAGEVAVEVKGAGRVDGRDLKSLKYFMETHKPRAAYVVCQEKHPRIEEGITILSWEEFFARLWKGKIL